MKLKGVALAMLLGSGIGTGAAMQQSPLPQPKDPFYIPDGAPTEQHDEAEGHRRMEMMREKNANLERQRQMRREAAELLNLAGELQFKAQKFDGSINQAEMLHQAETIEKLAHNVKERMKGSR
jgi:hypothetical protein